MMVIETMNTNVENLTWLIFKYKDLDSFFLLGIFWIELGSSLNSTMRPAQMFNLGCEGEY